MQISPHGCLLAKSWQCQVHSLRPDFTCSNGHYFRRRWSIQHMDEAELAAGRVQVGEASILWHIEVDIEVDIEASEGPDVAAWSLLEASRPPVDLSGTCCSGPLDHVSMTTAYFPPSSSRPSCHNGSSTWSRCMSHSGASKPRNDACS